MTDSEKIADLEKRVEALEAEQRLRMFPYYIPPEQPINGTTGNPVASAPADMGRTE